MKLYSLTAQTTGGEVFYLYVRLLIVITMKKETKIDLKKALMKKT